MAADAVRPHGDPGWGYALKHAWLHFFIPFPQLLIWRAARKGWDTLTTLRIVYLSGVEVPVALTALLWRIQTDSSGEPSIAPEVFVGGLTLFGVVDLVLIHRFFHGPLDLASPEALCGAYRVRTMLAWSLSLSSYLLGFVGAFVTSEWTVAFPGAAFTAGGLLMTAPTSARLAAKQNEIRGHGSSLDLVDALVSTPFTTGRPKAT